MNQKHVAKTQKHRKAKKATMKITRQSGRCLGCPAEKKMAPLTAITDD